MAQVIANVCDFCKAEGRGDDVPAVSVPVMIGDAEGEVDACPDLHLLRLQEIRNVVATYGRPFEDERDDEQRGKVQCSLCQEHVALGSRESHARRMHNLTLCQVEFIGDLPFPSPAEGCLFGSARPQGIAQHVGRWHPEHARAKKAAKAANLKRRRR